MIFQCRVEDTGFLGPFQLALPRKTISEATFGDRNCNCNDTHSTKRDDSGTKRIIVQRHKQKT